ncbi:hypothetical protein NDU88_005623, partial [Pleurodeles waltl]
TGNNEIKNWPSHSAWGPPVGCLGMDGLKHQQTLQSNCREDTARGISTTRHYKK